MAVIGDDDRTCFGPYRIVRRIGSGGMGSVFEAEDTGLGHRVALKLLHPHVAARPGAARRFLREGRAAARIRHPHVVQVFALGTEKDTPYLAMELLDGGSLSDFIARRGALGVREALDLVLPVISAVAAAHDAGVIHRDLKPSNVGIAQRPGARAWPKVVDFGVSKVISDNAAHETATETVIGTAAYMAPEQARAANCASFRSDQYSLAVMLYQCIAGQLPFAGRSLYEVLESVMAAPLVPPSAHAQGIPRALDEAILRGLSRDADDRFPSARAFGAALLEAASEATRAAYGAEFLGHETADTDSAIVTDIAPVLAKERAASSRVFPTTGVGNSTEPSPGSNDRPKSWRAGKQGPWVALGALAAIASLVVGYGALVRVPVMPRAAISLTKPPVEAAAPSPSAKGAEADEVQSAAPRERQASGASSSPPIARPAANRPAASSVATSHGDRRRPPAANVLYGENGAPILP